MAYKKKFNPDALPAHAQPEEAAQALSHLQSNQKPNPASRPDPSPTGHTPPSRASPPHGQRPAAIQTNATSYIQNHQYGQRPQHPAGGIISPPPPTGYGWGPRPEIQSQTHRRPVPQNNYPPRTPAPPDPDSGELYPLFRAANASNTGSLTTSELGSALVNADFTPFDPQTIKSLMRMFSSSIPGSHQGPTITFPEFQNLWRFLAAWKELFERFDEDHSGRISLGEFSNALVAFGYRLSMPFVGLLYNSYGGQNNDRRPSSGIHHGMSFDLFVQACLNLKKMTDVFKSYDDDRDGYVTMSFEEFLTEIIRLRD